MDSTTLLVTISAALFGLIAGSFVNVVAHRVPQDRSVVRPGSACPHCDHPIRPRDNIPVVSWVLLRGKCRDCAAPISARYPIVEALTAVLFASVPLSLGLAWVIPAYLWYLGVTMALNLTDLDHKRIPNRILFPGIAVGAVLLGTGALLDGAMGSFGRGVAGAAVYFVVLLVVALVARGGFGFGDVKLAFLLGMFSAYLGWGHLAVAGVGAFLVGGVLALVLLLSGRRGRKDAIPFGPSMILAAWIALWFGDQIVEWWLR